MSPKYYLLIAALALLLTALAAHSAMPISASQALLIQNSTVLAKIVVGDLDRFASQYGATVRSAQIDLGGRSITAVEVTIGCVKLYGKLDGGIATLYYKGPASWLLKIADSPYVVYIYVKVMPEIFDRPAADVKSFIREGLPVPTLAYIREIIGASAVQRIYGVNGSGVVIAIVDTGVDYGHPDLQGALAWLIKLADGTEIKASSVSVSGSSLAYVDLRGRAGSVPLSAIASLEPLVLDADESQVVLLRGLRASGGYLQTAYSWFATINPNIEFLTAQCDYYVGGLKSSSGVYKFGMTSLYIPWLAWYYGSPYVSVGVVMYDPDAPGVYTRMRVDIKTIAISRTIQN